MKDWKQWQADMAKWEAAKDELLARNRHVHALAAERANKNFRFDLVKFFSRFRVRFENELARIPTP